MHPPYPSTGGIAVSHNTLSASCHAAIGLGKLARRVFRYSLNKEQFTATRISESILSRMKNY